MSTKEERFLQFCDWLKASRGLETNAYVASTLGMSPASYSAINTGKNKLGVDLVCLIATNHPQLNLDWLLIGRGAMLDGKKVLVNTKHGIREYIPIPYNPWEFPDDPEIYSALRGASEYTERLLKGEEPVQISPVPKPTPTVSTQVTEWKDKYYDILEKYNSCLERERVGK